jgi:hypothetical protein
MTLVELIEEVHEKTHVDRVKILSRMKEAWPDGRSYFTGTQCALVERSLRLATASPECISPLRRL